MGRQASRQPNGEVGATLATSAFEKLRSDILRGVIAPGEKLRVDALKERYGIGASPLREALNRLSSIHLVEQIEQKGFRVTLITRDQVFELAQTRCWISEIAVREAIANGDWAWEEAVVLAHHRLRRCHEALPTDAVNEEWEHLHRRFHTALIAACPSRWILDFHETLFDLADRVRFLSMKRPSSERNVLDEHEQIAKAVTSRDTALSIQLLNRHFLQTAEYAAKSIG